MTYDMAKRTYKGGTRAVRNIEREIVQNQQAYTTSVTTDVLYTADDMVTLKRIILDLSAAIGPATVGAHALGAIYLVPKDMSTVTITVTDGQVEAPANFLLGWPYQWTPEADGNVMVREHMDAKFSRKLQPGDRIVLHRLASNDTGILFEKLLAQMFFAH